MASKRHEDGRKTVDSCATQLAVIGVVVAALFKIVRRVK